MSDQEFKALFDAPADGEEIWNLPVDTKLGAMELPLVRHQIVQEIKDQAEIKASQRKAILRATQKAVVRGNKLGLAKLTDQDVEQYKWNLFIIRVDEAIKGRHAAIRDDWDFAETIADEGAFNAA